MVGADALVRPQTKRNALCPVISSVVETKAGANTKAAERYEKGFPLGTCRVAIDEGLYFTLRPS